MLEIRSGKKRFIGAQQMTAINEVTPFIKPLQSVIYDINIYHVNHLSKALSGQGSQGYEVVRWLEVCLRTLLYPPDIGQAWACRRKWL